MITQMGIPSRIAAIRTDMDASLLPDRRTAPWKITGMPAVGAGSIAGTYDVCGAVQTALASSTALTTVVDITGSGFIDFCALQAGTTTATTLRIKITVDGVAIKDYTSSSGTSTGRALVLIGDRPATSMLIGGYPLYFRSSLKVEVQQSGAASSNALMRYFLAEPFVL
jgi:hypothetical protein